MCLTFTVVSKVIHEAFYDTICTTFLFTVAGVVGCVCMRVGKWVVPNTLGIGTYP